MANQAVNYNQKWLIQFNTIDSTNNYATKMVEDGLAHHGKVIWALQQTNGRGQRGKPWITNENENIMMSLILQGEKLGNTHPIHLNMLIANTLCRYFQQIIPNVNIAIKWPNDIYFNDKKTVGILIENIFRGNKWNSAIIGLGINVNQTDYGILLPNAGSLAYFAKKQFELFPIISDLRAGILNEFQQFQPEQFDQLLEHYNDNLFGRNQWRTFINRSTQESFEGKVLKVNANGMLLIETKKGIQEFGNGEIEWIINK